MQEVKFIAVESDEGLRLDKCIAVNHPEVSRSYVQKLIESGGAWINGNTGRCKDFVKVGDEIKVLIPEPEGLEVEAEDIPLDIVYEDDDVILVNKPKGLVVHPAAGHYTGTLVNGLLYHCKGSLSGINGILRPGIVHRIDKDTSGLLVVAKNDKSHESLAGQIAEHSCFRHYLALLEGNLKDDSGTIDTFISRSTKDRKMMAVSESGKRAITHYKVLERYGNYCLVEFVLETGRTHQIRVHSKHLGHPIVGDKTYGFKNQKFNLEGQLLHAYKLELTHPTSGKRLSFECEIPDYFTKILNKLRNK